RGARPGDGRDPRAGQGAGEDEQRDLGGDGGRGVADGRLDVLRDDRRWAGREPWGERALGRPRRHVEHAQYAGRGVGAGVSAAGTSLRSAAGEWGRGEVGGWGGRNPGVRGPSADGAECAGGAAPPRGPRGGGRGERRARMHFTGSALLGVGLPLGTLLGAKRAGALPAVALRRASGGFVLLVSVKFLLW